MKRRFLAMLLSLAMVLTMLPVSAFAAVSLEGQTLTVVATSEDSDSKTVKVTTLKTTENTPADVNGNVYYKFLSTIPDEVPTSITVSDTEYKQISVTDINAGTNVTRTNEPYIAVATLNPDATSGDQTPTAWGIALIDEPAAISDTITVSDDDRKITGISVGSDTYKYKVFATGETVDVITTKTTDSELTTEKGWATLATDTTLPKTAEGTLVIVKIESNVVSAIATAEVSAAACTELTVTVTDGKVEVKETANGSETTVDFSKLAFYEVATGSAEWDKQNWNAATPASTVTQYFGDANKLTLSEAGVLTKALNNATIVAIRTTGEGAAATLDAIGESAEVSYTPPAAPSDPTALTVTVDAKTNAVTVTKPGANAGDNPVTVDSANLLFFKATDKNSWSSKNWNTDTAISDVQTAWSNNTLAVTNGKLPESMTEEAYVIAVEKVSVSGTDKLAGIGETATAVKYTEPELTIGEVTVNATTNVITPGVSADANSSIKYAIADKAFTGPVTAKTVWSSGVISSETDNKVEEYTPETDGSDSKIKSDATGKYLIAAVVKTDGGTVVSIACTKNTVTFYDSSKKHVNVSKQDPNDNNITIVTEAAEVSGTTENNGTATIKVTATEGYQPVVVSVNSTAVAEADAAKYKFTAGSNNEYTLNLTGLSTTNDTAIVIKSEAIKYTVTVTTTDTTNVSIVTPAAGDNGNVATVNSGATTEITVDVTTGYTPAITGLTFTKGDQTSATSGKVRWTVTTPEITENKSYEVTATKDGTGETFNVTVTTTDTTNVKIIAPAVNDDGDYVIAVAKDDTTEITVDVTTGYTPAHANLKFAQAATQTGVTSGMVRWTATTPAVTAAVTYTITASQTPTVETFNVTVTTSDSNVEIIAPADNGSGEHVASVAKNATATITVDVKEGFTPKLNGTPALTLDKTTGADAGKVRWTATTEAVTSNLTYTVTTTEDQQQPGDTFTVTVSTTDPNVTIVAPEAGDNGNVATVNKDATTVITVDVKEGYTPKLTGTPALTLEKTTGAASGNVRWTVTTGAVTSNLTYEVTATEDQQQTGNTTVEGNPDVSDDGTATGEVDTTDIDEVLNNATGTTDQIELDFSTPADTSKPVEKAEIAIPTEAVDSINDYNEAAKQPGSSKQEVSLIVKTPIGTVTVGSDVVEEMTKDSTFTDDKGQTVTPDATTEAKVVLNVEKVAVPGETAPDPDEKQAFEIHFEKKLVSKANGDVVATAPVEVKNTTVTITVATTVQPKTGTNTLIAAFVDGVKKTVVDWAARYDRGNATFTTPHLSTFVLMAERDSDTPSGILIYDKDGNAVDLDTISGDTVTIPAGGKLVLPSTIATSNRANVKYESGAWVLDDTTKDGALEFTLGSKTYKVTLQAASATTPTTLTLTPDGKIGYAIIKVKITGMTNGKVYLVESTATPSGGKVNSYSVITGDDSGEAVIAISLGNVVTVKEYDSEADLMAGNIPPTATSNSYRAQ